MARINFTKDWWGDKKRSNLMIKFGDDRIVDGLMAQLWNKAMELWSTDKGESGYLMEGSYFIDNYKGVEAVLEVGLVRLYKVKKLILPQSVYDQDGKQNEIDSIEENRTQIELSSNLVRERFIYFRGSFENFSWWVNYRKQRSEGGKKSAEIRKLRTGTAQPSKLHLSKIELSSNLVRDPNSAQAQLEVTSNLVLSELELRPNWSRTASNCLEPTYTDTYIDTKIYIYKEYYTSLSLIYPDRGGLDKIGKENDILLAIDREFNNEALLEQLEISVLEYKVSHSHLTGDDRKYIKTLQNFIEDGTWKQYYSQAMKKEKEMAEKESRKQAEEEEIKNPKGMSEESQKVLDEWKRNHGIL